MLLLGVPRRGLAGYNKIFAISFGGTWPAAGCPTPVHVCSMWNAQGLGYRLEILLV